MKLLFELSKEDLELAKEEVLSLASSKTSETSNNLLILSSSPEIFKRLAYTHDVYQLLFTATNKDLEKKMGAFDWQSIYKTNFCVRKTGDTKYTEPMLASFVWAKLQNPEVNLKSPETLIQIFFSKKIYVCKHLFSIDKSFLQRKPHLRPELHPSSLNPKLARAMINLTGKTKGALMDPFCGTCGILLEATLMNFKVIGYDIDNYMIYRGRKNMYHYQIKDYKIEQNDATKIKRKADAIVTDLPYSKNTKKQDLNKLYKEFLKNAYSLTNILIIGFPSKFDYKKIKGKWKIEKEFTIYLHKTLSKRIVKMKK